MATSLSKPTHPNVSRVYAQQFKPWEPSDAQLDDPDLVYQIRYVVEGVENQVPTTREVWRRVTGPAHAPGRLAPGFDAKTHHEFVVLLDRATQQAVDVHLYPWRNASHGMVSAEQEGKTDIMLKIGKRGSVEVLAYPPKTGKATLRSVIAEIDTKETISIGMRLGGCEVVNIEGNKVSLRPPRTSSETEEEDE